MEVDQLKRTEQALIAFGSFVDLLTPFFPEIGKRLLPHLVDALVHPIEDKQGHPIKDLRAAWKWHGLTIPNKRVEPALTRAQQLFIGGLFVQTVEQIIHELKAIELLDEYRERKSHPLCSLRVIGARLMSFNDIADKAFGLGTQDSANISVHMAKAYVDYYTSNEWFGPGNPAWKRKTNAPL